MPFKNRFGDLGLEGLSPENNKTLKGDKEEIDDISSMPPLEGEEKKFVDIQLIAELELEKEEVKDRKRLKVITPDELLTRLSVLLAQLKAGRNTYKSDKYYIFCINTIKSSKSFTTI